MTPRGRTHPPRPLTDAAAEAPPDSETSRSKADAEVARLVELGEAQCTEAEAAAILELAPEAFNTQSKTSIRRRTALARGRSLGLKALRAAQLKLAETSAPMAIFLGRVYLGQSERREANSGEPSEVAEVAQAVRDRLAALVADANRYRAAQRDREIQ